MGKLEVLPVDSRVLDIGPGSGALGQFLKEKGLRKLSAVEIDAEARKHVASIYGRLATDLSEFRGDIFDVILLLDVLEHIVDVTGFFEQACRLLAPGGLILVSVPNIAHWSTRFSLFFGYFEPTDRGILDQTHVQFFTRKRFSQFLDARRELQIEELASSLEPVEFVLPEAICKNSMFKLLRRGQYELAQALPGLFAYQHLSLLKRKS